MWFSSANAADMSWCDQKPAEIQKQIRCALWRLTGFMNSLDQSGRLRGLGPTAIGPGRLVRAEADFDRLKSPWPNRIKIIFSGKIGRESRPVEEIRDHGLNGLDLDDGDDAYLRFQADEKTANLLRNLDPNLLDLINREYLIRLNEIIAVLDARENVHAPLAWRLVSPGLELAQAQAFRFIRLGESSLVFLRIDPNLLQLVPFSHRELAAPRPLTIEGWARVKPRSLALFNAGLYYPDHRYIGLFVKNGTHWGTGLHPTWKALLLSGGPIGDPDRPPAKVLDLRHHDYDLEKDHYRYAFQSFMLLDKDGRPRVRRTDRLASRTVVAQDVQDRILVIFVPGACTLYELALLLKMSDLKIKAAMCLDGGFESQVFVRAEPGNLVHYGAWVVNEKRQYHSKSLKLPLPAIVAVTPVRNKVR